MAPATLSSRATPWQALSGPLDTAAALLTGLSAATVLFSIAASQVLLGTALLCLLLARRPLEFPARLQFPLLAFVGWTLLALTLSPAPVSGLAQVRKLFVFFVVLLVCNAFRERAQIRRTVQGVLLAGIVAALFGLGQFAQRFSELQQQGLPFYENYITHQITGFMSHWMTFSGQLMLVVLLLTSVLLFGKEPQGARWGWLGVAAVVLALLAAFTRGLWLGTLLGLTYLIGSYRRWMVWLVPAGVLLLYLLAPPWLQQREQSILQPGADSSSLSRLVMIRTGLNMVADNPWFGVGLDRVGVEFARYRPADVAVPPAWYGHLHNSFLQIAAERGVPCLAILVWFLFEILRDNLARTMSREPQERALGFAAVAATLGMLVSGLFEFNFGDSEVLMLYLFVISVPYASGRLSAEGQRAQ